ncbi:hypothetical protein [Lucifera butyrica]|uniref:hypothetical protein n=1 Tax=Lucifera butyrica TaxID=1351585 RepID=UPI0014029BC2|nr:hypothetical protein [Lucifera butyrica]
MDLLQQAKKDRLTRPFFAVSVSDSPQQILLKNNMELIEIRAKYVMIKAEELIFHPLYY